MDSRVDAALEDLLNQLIENYVESWYQMLLIHEPDQMRDHKFIHEVKYMIRHAVANLILRLVEVDLVDLVTRDLITTVMNHIVVYQNGKRKSKSAQYVEEAVLQEYQQDNLIHLAVTSRDNELIYLKKLSELLLPHLLPPKYVNCSYARTLIREIVSSLILLPVIDAVSDPSFVNRMLVESLGGHAADDSYSNDVQSGRVEILTGFSSSSHCCGKSETTSSDEKAQTMSFGISLKQVADDAQMLFLFMQFLKEEGAVNLIQFYLAYEALTVKLLNPDPSHYDTEVLVSEARTLYKSFIDPVSIDCIRFSDSSVEKEVRNILSECEKKQKSVAKLRTCESLYTASFEVNLILEKYYLDVFFETSFYLKMVSGPRWPSLEAAAYSFITPDVIPKKFQHKHRRQTSMTSLKRVVKESFWPSPDDGLIPPSASFNSFTGMRSSSLCEVDRIENGVDLLDGFDRSDQLIAGHSSDEPHIESQARVFKSMKDWDISIHQIGTRLDPGLKYFHVFVINVKDGQGDCSADQADTHSSSKSWRVERRFNEFYALESKLREFHGESLQSYQGFYPLPSRNWSFISTPKQTIHFLDTKKDDLQKFLSSLVTCDKLCGSQLVYNFLSDSAEFIPSSIADALSIKKIMKNVPAKLTSEKGQNLDSFLSTLVQCAMGPEKDWDDDDDNGCVTPPEDPQPNPVTQLRVIKNEAIDEENSGVNGAFDFFLFLLVRVLGFATTSALVSTVVTLESVVRNTMDSLLTTSIAYMTTKLTEPQFLVSLLRKGKAAFAHADLSDGRSAKDKRQNTERNAQLAIKTRFQELIPVLLPDDKVEEVAFLFYSVLQHQKLNKQLLYLTIDSLVTRSFPLIVSNDGSD